MLPDRDLDGVPVFTGWFDRPAQEALVAELRQVIAAAPLIQHETRRGQKLSVRMSAAGEYGWISDRRGYRYARQHPMGMGWPPIPEALLTAWEALCDTARAPQCCLVNWYGEGARMGLHQDRDEADLTQPVLSVSLGDEGLFRVGGTERGGKTRSLWLGSGDVVVLGGENRLRHHGVDRIRFGSSTLLPRGGRINLTLRVVD